MVERTLTYLTELNNPMTSIIYEHTQDDPIEELHEEPMIEHIVEDSPHVTIAENIEYLRYLKFVAMLIFFQKALMRKPLQILTIMKIFMMCMMTLLYVHHLGMKFWKD